MTEAGYPSVRVAALPRAVVLSCKGAAEGDLNVVRSLGRCGIPVTVIAEYENAPASQSRYCTEFALIPLFTRDPKALRNFLIEYAGRQTHRPVLFPTADPDLLLLSQLRAELRQHFHLPLASASLVDTLVDKARFAELASQHGLPVPATHVAHTLEEAAELASRLRFPVMLKPPHPTSWSRQSAGNLTRDRKALIAQNRSDYLSACQELFQSGLAFLTQEYIPGGDEEHFDLHAYVDSDCKVRACFTGRKIRVWPPHAGSGCYVVSTRVEPLIALGMSILQKIGFTGLANLNFKRDPWSGQFRLLEINPRVSQWNILGAVCGINLPYLAYCDAVGAPPPGQAHQIENVYYIHFRNDARAFCGYRRFGEWSLWRYLVSLCRGRRIYQLLAWDDLKPWFMDACLHLSSRLRRIMKIRSAI
jgi:D-aspartate ligase